METVPARLTNGITFSELRPHKYFNEESNLFTLQFARAALSCVSEDNVMTRITDIIANIISIDNEKRALLVQESANYAPAALE